MTTRETIEEAAAMIARLQQLPLLAGLAPAQLALLADCALTSRFRRGEIIFREGEAANRFYLIETGWVALESGVAFGEPVVIETIGGEDLLGWSWMLPPYVWHFSARAIEPTQVIHFESAILREYCERDHSLGFELHKRMSTIMMKRLQAARRKMVAIHARDEILSPVIGLPPSAEVAAAEGGQRRSLNEAVLSC